MYSNAKTKYEIKNQGMTDSLERQLKAEWWPFVNTVHDNLLEIFWDDVK